MTPHYEHERKASLRQALSWLHDGFDPGMCALRSDLIAANLPITPEGEAIVESDDV